MRVTHEMIANQVVYNLSESMTRFFKLQNQMSTNKRINKASDDPIGTIKDLSYRERLSEITQYKSNIGIGQTWLASTDSALNDVNQAILDAHTVAVEMSNDTFDSVARQAAANEVQSLFDKVLAAGNSQLQGSYLFSGYRTRTNPFDMTASGVVYRGDSGVIEYTIDSKAKVQINTIGSNLLTKPFTVIGQKADLASGIVSATTLASLNGGNGVDMTPGTFTVKDLNRNISVAIDISAQTTVNDAILAINAQLAAGGITNVTASLGLEGSNLRLIATADPRISATTPLGNLNSGTGVDMVPGQFKIKDQLGAINVTIDLTGNLTVGDAIASINSQLLAGGVLNVTAAINAGGTGIDISDTNGVPLGLSIEENTINDSTAANLGLSGAISPVLNGLDVNPKPSFEVAEAAPGQTTAADLGLVGQFSLNLIGNGLKPQLLPTTNIAQLHNNVGISSGGIKISQGDMSVVIDTAGPGIVTIQDLIDEINGAGLNVTAAINAGHTGIQITNNDPTRTLTVTNADENRTATNLGIYGASDVLGSMMLLMESLRNDDRVSISSIIGTLDSALNSVLNERAATGAKSIRMETTLSRLEEYEVNYTKLLSEVEDADVTRLITDLAMQENAYTAALNAAAKILQPTLLNFLR
jgi:flagellin-like hook-associated protein FlgL